MTHVTAAIITNEEDAILICQRGAGGSCCAYLWEFPGGKVEPGETPEQCIVRECQEELKIKVTLQGVYAETVHQYPEQELAFTFFKARVLSGTLQMGVHKDIKWVKPEELTNYEFCPADVKIVEQLIKEIK